MAVFWTRVGGARAPLWEPRFLDQDLYALVPETGPEPYSSDQPDRAAALLVRSAVDARAFALIARAEISLNGAPLHSGLSMLSDRDEIRFSDGRRFYFSTERLATIEPFPAVESPVYCVRCKTAIDRGVDALRCVGCDLWYHQTAELGCFTYSKTCPVCETATALDAGYRWTPEEI